MKVLHYHYLSESQIHSFQYGTNSHQGLSGLEQGQG